jgi:hypothetical protein
MRDTPTARHDIYGPIHKALRLALGRTLTRIGAVDVADEDDLGAALAEIERLIELCRLHLAHENHHVHPLLEAAEPGASTQAAREHRAHREELDALAGARARCARLLRTTGRAWRATSTARWRASWPTT